MFHSVYAKSTPAQAKIRIHQVKRSSNTVDKFMITLYYTSILMCFAVSMVVHLLYVDSIRIGYTKTHKLA